MEANEIWKPIPEADGLYEASSTGRVRSMRPSRNTCAGHLLKPYKDRLGYMRVNLFKHHNKVVNRMVHRLIAAAFLGAVPLGCEVNHKDGDKGNNAVSNLEYLTHSQNILHSYHVLGNKSYGNRGANRGKFKGRYRDAELVKAICDDAKRGDMTLHSIANKYGAPPRTVRRLLIVNGVVMKPEIAQRTSKSGARGVCWDKGVRKWVVRIGTPPRRTLVGYFDDLDEAIVARDIARTQQA